MESTNIDAVVVFGCTTLCRLATSQASRYSPMNVKIQYINGLRKDAHVLFRSGFSIAFPSMPINAVGYVDSFIIRTTYNLDSIITRSAAESLSYAPKDPEVTAGILLSIREAFDEQVLRGSYNGANITIDTVVTHDMLLRSGGSVYMDDVDLIVSIVDFEALPVHPYSRKGREKARMRKRSEQSSPSSFSYTLEVVDNRGIYGIRYSRIGDKVFKISPIKDNTRQDGVYVVSPRPSEGEYVFKEVIETFYTFEDAEKLLGLFRTYDLAFHSGDLAGHRKIELTEKEHENLLLKSKIIREKEEVDQSKNILEMFREMENSRYEREALDRRKHLEMLKYLPAVIAGLGALYLSVKSLIPKKTT